jgi:hypothetical protein
MSPHELKVKFLSDLNLLTGVQTHPLIPLHINLQKINDPEALKETINLTDKLYSTLENLYLTGETAYPIVSKYINELIPEIEIHKEKILAYLSNYKISTDETSINLIVIDSIKLQKVKPKDYDESVNNPDFEIVFRYKMFESLNEKLDNLFGNLKFLNDQINRKTHSKNKSISHPGEIPDLKEIFKSEIYFNHILERTKGEFHKYYATAGQYEWIKGAEYLAAFACQLRDKHRLKDTYKISNNQFLRKVFCKFFNLKTSNKTFQPDRIDERKKAKFSFIVESDT